MTTEVATGVWQAGTRFVNWYIVDEGSQGCVLVDAGLPGYHRDLRHALKELNRQPEDVRAVLLTHGHIDHVGMAAYLTDFGATIYIHTDDAPLAAAPRTNKTERSVIAYLRYPATLAFVAHAVANGAAKPARAFPHFRTLQEGQHDDIPGAPRVVHTPGHTLGSCTIEFPEHGVVCVGDLLCTVDPITARPADPQLQTRGSNRSSSEALSSLQRLETVQAQIVLPGHGRPWNGGVEAAAASARRIGCR